MSELSTWQLLALGIIGVTWIFAGLAASSITFAITVRRHPETFLKHQGESLIAFLLMTLMGWLWFLAIVIASWLDPDFRSAGLLLPGSKARKEAKRIALRNLRHQRAVRRSPIRLVSAQ